MPVQSRHQGDDLLVDNVDIKRAARNFLSKTRDPSWTPPGNLNQAMEFMAASPLPSSGVSPPLALRLRTAVRHFGAHDQAPWDDNKAAG